MRTLSIPAPRDAYLQNRSLTGPYSAGPAEKPRPGDDDAFRADLARISGEGLPFGDVLTPVRVSLGLRTHVRIVVRNDKKASPLIPRLRILLIGSALFRLVSG